MNKVLIILSLLFVSPALNAQSVSIEGGRFMKGDNPSWSAYAFDDSAWREVSFEQSWEQLDLDRVNGIGWYRIHVVIPSSMKKGIFTTIRSGRKPWRTST